MGALESVLGPLGVVLGRSWGLLGDLGSFLWDLEAVLGRSWSPLPLPPALERIGS